MLAVCADLGISPKRAHNLRRQLTFPEPIRERVAERPTGHQLSVTMANRLADMHELAPELTQAVAKRITSTDLHDSAAARPRRLRAPHDRRGRAHLRRPHRRRRPPRRRRTDRARPRTPHRGRARPARSDRRLRARTSWIASSTPSPPAPRPRRSRSRSPRRPATAPAPGASPTSTSADRTSPTASGSSTPCS